jgi:hypothetical protein
LFCTVFPKIHLRRNVYVSSEKEEEWNSIADSS